MCYIGAVADAATLQDASRNDSIYCEHRQTWTGRPHIYCISDSISTYLIHSAVITESVFYITDSVSW